MPYVIFRLGSIQSAWISAKKKSTILNSTDMVIGLTANANSVERLVNSRYRILILAVSVAAVKLVIAGWIADRLSVAGRSAGHVFVDWDSAFFISIAENGYPAWEGLNRRLYAFLPAYPALIRAVVYVLHDYWLAASLCALVLGVASVVLFQMTAELYLPRRGALIATIVFTFFPYVFLFTSVAYTEPLFLFTTLACWLLHKKHHPFASAIFAIIATLTREYGILIIVPIAYDFIRTKQTRYILTLTLPIASLLGWCYFCFNATGDWLASLTSQRVAWGTVGLGESLYQILFMNRTLPHGTDVALIAFLAILVFPVLRSFKIDYALGIYSTLLFLLLLLAGSRISMVRYVSFIFPLWITFPMKSLRSALLCMPIFLIVTAALWFEFASGLWVA